MLTGPGFVTKDTAASMVGWAKDGVRWASRDVMTAMERGDPDSTRRSPRLRTACAGPSPVPAQVKAWLPALLATILIGCGTDPLIPYDTATPPALLVPVAAAGVTDQRSRFREIFCALSADHGADLPDHRPCAEALHQLDGEAGPTGQPVNLGRARVPLQLLIVPGVGADCLAGFAVAYGQAAAHLEGLGYQVGVVAIAGLAGTERNAALIRDAVLAVDDDAPLVLLGYSKGTPDILEALASYPDVAARVTAMVSVAGSVNGSPLAGLISKDTLSLLQHAPGATCATDDLGALAALDRAHRLRWWATHDLPPEVPLFSLVSFAAREQISAINRSTYDDLALIDPRNDGQMLFYDQVIPGSTLLGYLNGDHWAVALDITRDGGAIPSATVTRNNYPREILLEAVVKYVEEPLPAGS